jgi:transcriptional regulator with XRE-family HTH domain
MRTAIEPNADRNRTERHDGEYQEPGMNVPIDVEAIRAKLVELGWTQAELAEASRLQKRSVEAILSRGTASLESLHRLANALEVDVNALRRLPLTTPRLSGPVIATGPIVDEVVGLLIRRELVNLVVSPGAKWRPVVAEIASRLTTETGERVGTVDLEEPHTVRRKGLLDRLLTALGLRDGLPDKPDDLVEFGKRLDTRKPGYVIVTHFDHVALPDRQAEYGVDLFNTIRWYSTNRRMLALLLVSRRPLSDLLPKDHPLSGLDARTVELGPVS